MAHDLVIGGSGMLAGLVSDIAQGGRDVSVVARGQALLQALAARHPAIHPLALDYCDPDALRQGLAECSARFGPIRRCVAWMHDDDIERALAVARLTGDLYCQVLGSASADPSRPEALARWRAAFSALEQPRLLLVVLGFMIADGRSRWLTDAEISGGVLDALHHPGAGTRIVGTVEPWSARP